MPNSMTYSDRSISSSPEDSGLLYQKKEKSTNPQFFPQSHCSTGHGPSGTEAIKKSN